MVVRCWLLPAVAWLVPVTGVLAYEDPVLVEGEATAGYDNNVFNVADASERTGDAFLEAGGRLNHFSRLGLYFSSELEGSLRGRYYSDYYRLSLLTPELQARLNWRARGGFHTPLVSLHAATGYRTTRATLRDGAYARTGLLLDQPLTTRLAAQLYLNFTRRYADNDVYEHRYRRFGLGVDWEFTEHTRLHAGVSRRQGGTVSTGEDSASLRAASSAWEEDDARPGEAGALAYRFDAATDELSLGLDRTLGEDTTLDLNVLWLQADLDSDWQYRRRIISAGLRRDF